MLQQTRLTPNGMMGKYDSHQLICVRGEHPLREGDTRTISRRLKTRLEGRSSRNCVDGGVDRLGGGRRLGVKGWTWRVWDLGGR